MNLHKILAVIVLYKSTLEESKSFKTLLASVESERSVLKVLIYNNSPEYWQYEGEKFAGLEMISINDHYNSGVSKAYNAAYSHAKDLGKEYILLLDQDTKISAIYLNTFCNAQERYESELYCPMIMNGSQLISPAKFYLYTTKKIEFIDAGIQPLKGLAIINSGLIISVKLFGLAGGYNECIKLDFSDFDFLKRSRKYTNHIVVLNAKCQHSLSSEVESSLVSALHRFTYYLQGAWHYNKSFFDAMGLMLWIFLRSFKLNLKYKSMAFTLGIFQFILKKHK